MIKLILVFSIILFRVISFCEIKEAKISIIDINKIYRFGEKIEFKVIVKNLNQIKSIVFDTQPYYLLTENNIMLMHTKCNGLPSTVSHIFIRKIKSPYNYSELHGDGGNVFISDDNYPYTVSIKPKISFIQNIQLKSELCKKYLEKGKWFVTIAIGWDFSKINNSNSLSVFENGKMVCHSIIKIPIIKIPVVENLTPFSLNWPKNEGLKNYSKRRLFYKFVFSETFEIKID